MAITDSILALLRNPQQATDPSQQIQMQNTPVAAPQQPQPQQSWVTDLITQHQQDGGRLKRTPVGFDFQRQPFDPSSYYNQLNDLKTVSSMATQVAQIEAQNRADKQAAADAAASQNALAGLSSNPLSGSGGGTFSGNSGSKTYYLKGVKSDVARAAQELGPMFGIKTIYGKGPGSVPGSDHPKGLATDFMINNTKNGKARGDALANYVIKNYKQLNVKYVIWYRYIWHPGRGWSKYSGPSDHTDHVHVSYNS